MLSTPRATNFEPSEYKKSTKWQKKNSFSFNPFQNGFCIFQNSCIISYLIKCIIWALPNIDVCIIYWWKKIEFNCIILYSFNMKIIIKTRTQIILKDSKVNLCFIQSIFGFFIWLTWYHCNYNHTPIHYIHEEINVIKIQNSPLQSFFLLECPMNHVPVLIY
jgi:hypothetical protein